MASKTKIAVAVSTALGITNVNAAEVAVITAAQGELQAMENTAQAVREMIEPNLPDSPEAAAQVAALLVKVLTLPDGSKTSEAKGKKEEKGSVPYQRALIHGRIRAAFARAKADTQDGAQGRDKVRAIPKDPQQLAALCDANIGYLQKTEKSKFADTARLIAAWKALKGGATAK